MFCFSILNATENNILISVNARTRRNSPYTIIDSLIFSKLYECNIIWQIKYTSPLCNFISSQKPLQHEHKTVLTSPSLEITGRTKKFQIWPQ